MAEHCAACRSTDLTTGLDGYGCIHCGAYTVDGEVVRKEVTSTVVEKREAGHADILVVCVVVIAVIAVLWAFGVLPA